MKIVERIHEQIGHKAFLMMGAKMFMTMNENTLGFKIGRNSNSINWIEVKLNAKDLYDVSFYSVRGMNRKLKSSASGIYNDMLKQTIESKTGMYLSL